MSLFFMLLSKRVCCYWFGRIQLKIFGFRCKGIKYFFRILHWHHIRPLVVYSRYLKKTEKQLIGLVILYMVLLGRTVIIHNVVDFPFSKAYLFDSLKRVFFCKRRREMCVTQIFTQHYHYKFGDCKLSKNFKNCFMPILQLSQTQI